MMESNYNNQPNPSGIWQSIWLKLIMEAIEQYSNGNYLKSYSTMKILKEHLPPECKTDTEEQYTKTEKICEQGFKIKSYDYQTAQIKQIAYFSNNLANPLLNLFGDVTNSLFKHGWINKSFMAKPKFSGGGTL